MTRSCVVNSNGTASKSAEPARAAAATRSTLGTIRLAAFNTPRSRQTTTGAHAPEPPRKSLKVLRRRFQASPDQDQGRRQHHHDDHGEQDAQDGEGRGAHLPPNPSVSAFMYRS